MDNNLNKLLLYMHVKYIRTTIDIERCNTASLQCYFKSPNQIRKSITMNTTYPFKLFTNKTIVLEDNLYGKTINEIMKTQSNKLMIK